MPAVYEPWVEYSLDELSRADCAINTAEGHQQVVAILARDIARSLIDGMAAKGVQLEETALNAYYHTFFQFLCVYERTLEHDNPLINQPAFTLSDLNTLSSEEQIEFMATHVLAIQRLIDAYSNHISRLNAYKGSLEEEKSAFVTRNKKRIKSKQEVQQLETLDASIASCNIWLSNLERVQCSAYILLKTLILQQMTRLVNILREYKEPITSIDMAKHIIAFLTVSQTLKMHAENLRGIESAIHAFIQCLDSSLPEQHQEIATFCQAFYEKCREKAILFVHKKYFIAHITVIDFRFNQYVAIPNDGIKRRMASSLHADAERALKELFKFMNIESERNEWRALLDTLLLLYDFFLNKPMFLTADIDKLTAQFRLLAQLDLAKDEPTMDFLYKSLSKTECFLVIFKANQRDLFPLVKDKRQLSIQRLKSLIAFLDAMKFFIPSKYDPFNELEAEVKKLYSSLENERPRKKEKAAVSSSAGDTDEGRRIQSEMARAENKRRTELKQRRNAALISGSAASASSSSSGSGSGINSHTSSPSSSPKPVVSASQLSCTPQIRRLFLDAQYHSAHDLSRSIVIMQEAYHQADGDEKELAFVRLVHYQLLQLSNQYHSSVSKKMSLYIKEIITPVDVEHPTEVEIKALRDQQFRACKLAASYEDTEKTYQSAGELLDMMNDEKATIKDPLARKMLAYLAKNAGELRRQVLTDYRACLEFLAQTKKLFQLLPKKNNPESQGRPSIFTLFYKVEKRLKLDTDFDADVSSTSCEVDDSDTEQAFQAELLEARLANEPAILFHKNGDGSLDVEVTHVRLAEFARRLKEGNNRVYLKGGSINRIFTQDVLLSDMELDLTTDSNEETVTRQLMAYIPSKSLNVPHLMHIETEETRYDVMHDFGHDLKEEASKLDVTRSAVYLEYCPTEHEKPHTVRFKVHDPLGKGISHIRKNKLCGVAGCSLEEVTNTIERVRRILKALLQNAKPVKPADVAFLNSGKLLQVLFHKDDPNDKAVGIGQKPSTLQIKQLYLGLLSEAGKALRALPSDVYKNAACYELAWLLSPEVLPSLSADAPQNRIEYFLRKRMLTVFEDHGIIPRGYADDQTLLTATDFPVALTQKLHALKDQALRASNRRRHGMFDNASFADIVRSSRSTSVSSRGHGMFDQPHVAAVVSGADTSAASASMHATGPMHDESLHF